MYQPTNTMCCLWFLFGIFTVIQAHLPYNVFCHRKFYLDQINMKTLHALYRVKSENNATYNYVSDEFASVQLHMFIDSLF